MHFNLENLLRQFTICKLLTHITFQYAQVTYTSATTFRQAPQRDIQQSESYAQAVV